ncbi:acyl carrier protein [Streptomyces sp. SL13]|uniref:Acyl carrier protein n=1 Tax=Streptantibioticus silvisoli TaxID=2705255 RepID=A0AA90H339_9ACTN|nr:acyl carrier protein [Streptantibioticus silvisoli]MDI5962459.1 acyl carrier protein [Streptantibioticus silvisoli]MDI5967970.1 acyl carrier protein [Streptantibioticus silvisoli]
MPISPSDSAAPDAATVLDVEELRLTVAEVLDIEAADLTNEAHFVDDLQVDSLMALEVVVRLEKKYGVKFTESELRSVVSLQQAHDLLLHKLSTR